MKKFVMGFTMVELLIVMFISSLFMSFGYARYRDFSRRQTVVNAERELEGKLRQLQSDTLAGKKPVGCTGVLDGYAFEVMGTAGPPQYRTYGLCSTPAGPLDERTFSLSTDLIITMPTTNPIIFRPLTSGTNIPAGAVTITISNTTFGGSTATVRISRQGEIQ